MEAIVGRRATEGVVVPDVQLDIVLSDAAEIRVVATGRNRANVVLRSSHCARDEGVDAVGPDHYPGALLDWRSASAMTSNSHDGIVGHQQPVDGEALPNLDAGLGRCIRQEAVEHGPPRTEPAPAIIGVGNGAAKSERADIERHVAADRRRPCRRQRAAETPPREDLGSVRPDDVRRDGIAREGGSVDEQHLESLLRQEHGGRRARATRADDDGIVHLSLRVDTDGTGGRRPCHQTEYPKSRRL
jgi:hypothetical protein